MNWLNMCQEPLTKKRQILKIDTHVSVPLNPPFLLQAEHRTMAAFVLAMIVNEYQNGQVSLLLQ